MMTVRLPFLLIAASCVEGSIRHMIRAGRAVMHKWPRTMKPVPPNMRFSSTLGIPTSAARTRSTRRASSSAASIGGCGLMRGTSSPARANQRFVGAQLSYEAREMGIAAIQRRLRKFKPFDAVEFLRVIRDGLAPRGIHQIPQRYIGMARGHA